MYRESKVYILSGFILFEVALFRHIAHLDGQFHSRYANLILDIITVLLDTLSLCRVESRPFNGAFRPDSPFSTMQ